jgi:hypothetical protein
MTAPAPLWGRPPGLRGSPWTRIRALHPASANGEQAGQGAGRRLGGLPHKAVA